MFRAVSQSVARFVSLCPGVRCHGVLVSWSVSKNIDVPVCVPASFPIGVPIGVPVSWTVSQSVARFVSLCPGVPMSRCPSATVGVPV